jgi:hypothetical protein
MAFLARRGCYGRKRYRFTGKRCPGVFKPDKLADWLRARGLTLASRAHLITDAGQLVPGFNQVTDGVEFLSTPLF